MIHTLLCGVSGRVTFIIRDPVTLRELRRFSFRNLLTDSYLDAVMSKSVPASLTGGAWMAVSSDATAPTFSDTTIAGQIGARSQTDSAVLSGNTFIAGAPDYGRTRVCRRFGSTITGTIAKIGLFSASSGGMMYAAALVADENGTPAPYTKGTEVVDILWELRIQPPQADVVESVTIGGVPYTTTVRAAGCVAGSTVWPSLLNAGLRADLVWSGSGGLIARGALPASGTGCTVTIQPYVAGTFYRDALVTNPASANVFFWCSSSGGTLIGNQLMQMGFAPNYPAAQQATLRLALARL